MSVIFTLITFNLLYINNLTIKLSIEDKHRAKLNQTDINRIPL